MAEVIVYTAANGQVEVVVPVSSMADALGDVPLDVEDFVIDQSEVPPRRFRSCWELSPQGKPKENPKKARELVKDQLRASRRFSHSEGQRHDQEIDAIGDDLDALEQYRRDRLPDLFD